MVWAWCCLIRLQEVAYTPRHGRFSAPVRKCVIAENCTQLARQLRDAPMVVASTGCTIYWRLGHRFVVALETLSDWLACSEVLLQAVGQLLEHFPLEPACLQALSPAQRTFISQYALIALIDEQEKLDVVLCCCRTTKRLHTRASMAQVECGPTV